MDVENLSDAIEKQSVYVHSLSYDELDAAVCDRAKLILLDSIACMAIGNSEYDETGIKKGDYPIIGQGRADKSSAVFFNGAAMVKNELDEGNQFAFGHPACHFIPAFMAECKDVNPSGKEAITSIVAAYEVSCRWGSSTKIKPSMHGHGTMQTAASAVVSAKLNHCEKDKIYKAIILANSLPQATTWNSAFHGDQLRNAYVGLANDVGMNAYRMVQAGIESSVESLISVWGETLDGDIKADGLRYELGKEFYITKNYFKVHAACRYTHSFVDMMQEFMRGGLKPDEVEKIDIETYHAASKLSGHTASNTFASKFSIPVSLAVCMVYGDISIENLSEAHIKDARVLEIAKKVSVKENDDFNELLPDIRKNRITVWLKNGETVEKEQDITKGDYLNPYSREEVTEKFYKLTEKCGALQDRMK